MSSMYIFSPKCGSPSCHALLTVQKTLIGGRSYSSTTDNLLDFYKSKTKQYLYKQTYCHLLSLDENAKRCLRLRINSSS